jgi:hypothetical protein
MQAFLLEWVAQKICTSTPHVVHLKVESREWNFGIEEIWGNGNIPRNSCMLNVEDIFRGGILRTGSGVQE